MSKILKCENCKHEIKKLKEDDFGEEIDWNTHWEQYLCDDCYAKIWESLLDWACSQCYNHPCEKGRDCWVNPFPRIMYLCYVAPRMDAQTLVKRGIEVAPRSHTTPRTTSPGHDATKGCVNRI